MKPANGFYSVIQFSARPSSFEYVNAGVVIAVPDRRSIRISLSNNAQRVKRLFDFQNGHDFKNMAKAFASRIDHEFRIEPSLRHLDYFSQSRANLFRLTPFLPIVVYDIDEDVNRLYREIMGEEMPQKRQPSIKRKLELTFRNFDVERFLDIDPDPVVVPGLKQPVRADFGYQNGHYNLIDGVSFLRAGNEFDIFSKAVMEAQLIKDFSDSKFIVVAEIPNSRDDLLFRLQDRLDRVGARVFKFDQLEPLVNDISAQARLHLRG